MRRIVRGIGRVLRGEGPETNLLDQQKVREGIMEFPVERKETAQESDQKGEPQ